MKSEIHTHLQLLEPLLNNKAQRVAFSALVKAVNTTIQGLHEDLAEQATQLDPAPDLNNWLLVCKNVGALVHIPCWAKPNDYERMETAFRKAIGIKDDYEPVVMWALGQMQEVLGIQYHQSLRVGGCVFTLFQYPSTPDIEVSAAKRHLRRNRDVMRIEVRRIQRWVKVEQAGL